MWRFKESEDGDEDICMDVAGFIFLGSQMSKEKTKRRFWMNPTFGKRKILNYTSLPYSTFEFGKSMPSALLRSHTALRPLCR